MAFSSKGVGVHGTGDLKISIRFSTPKDKNRMNVAKDVSAIVSFCFTHNARAMEHKMDIDAQELKLEFADRDSYKLCKTWLRAQASN